MGSPLAALCHSMPNAQPPSNNEPDLENLTTKQSAASVATFQTKMDKLPPLLSLSPPLRQRIYRFVGLVPSISDRPYQFNLNKGKLHWATPEPRSFHGLLLSCRLIYAETAALLYSGSRFVLRYDPAQPEPLRPLHALTTTALASLTNLIVILNDASCHQKEDSGNSWCCLEGHELDPPWGGLHGCKHFHRDSHQLPLLTPVSRSQPDSGPRSNGDGTCDDEVAAAQSLVAKWHLAAACLCGITTGRLELALVCDIDPLHTQAPEIASLITAPLRLIPQLRDCRIRLCKTPDPRLQQTARDCVLQACRITPPPYEAPKPSTGSFQATLTSLPRELRLRILEYTDLIVPNREVTWSRQDHRYATSVLNSYIDTNLRPFFCHWHDDPRWGFIGCFCRRRHACFTFRCKCWAPPGPTLFLICRTLCWEAQFTFFSGNRFIVHDYKDHPCWTIPFMGEDPDEGSDRSQESSQSEGAPEGIEQPDGTGQPEGTEQTDSLDYPSDRLAISQFLREVVPVHCLAHLRFLELVFPPYLAQTWPGKEHPVMQDWHSTVDWLRDKINAPGLTIRLVAAEVSCVSPRAYRRMVIPWSDGCIIGRAHMALALSLRPLAKDGLARFYVHLPYPWEFTVPPGIRDERWLHTAKLKRESKERVERYVMEDRYEEVYANGMKEPEPSFWNECYYGLQ